MVVWRLPVSGLLALSILVLVDGVTLALLVELEPVIPRLSGLLVGVALPMANVLAFSLLPSLQRGARGGPAHPFQAGFLRFGSVALVLFLACAFAAPGNTVHAVLDPLRMLMEPGPWDWLVNPGRPEHSFMYMMVYFLVLLAIAVLGGCLSNRYQVKISITVGRRRMER